MTTVITFGTFDVFHVGHLRVIERAAAFGDRRTSRAVLALGLFGAVLATLDWRLRYGGFWDLNLGSMLFNAAFLAMFVGVAWGLGDVVRRRRAVLARLRRPELPA